MSEKLIEEGKFRLKATDNVTEKLDSGRVEERGIQDILDACEGRRKVERKKERKGRQRSTTEESWGFVYHD